MEVLGALDEGKANRDRAGAAAFLDDDPARDGVAGRERLGIDLDAQPHGSTHTGAGGPVRFWPTRRTRADHANDTQSPS